MTASVAPSPNRSRRSKLVRMPSLLLSICATDRIWRDSSLPDGSPTRVVPPPISTTGFPAPVACSQCSIMMDTRLPMWSEPAVQS